MTPIDETLKRVDDVLKQNRRIEWTYISLTVLLFLAGIGTLVSAMVTSNFAWATPSVVTTGLLYWPLRQIKDIRQKNIALAMAPMLIDSLPPEMAAVEIQRLLKRLFGEAR